MNWLQRIGNYLSGGAMIVGGVSLYLHGQVEAGISMIIAGIGKITAQEILSNQISKKEDKKPV